jgi:hypothetical protein
MYNLGLSLLEQKSLIECMNLPGLFTHQQGHCIVKAMFVHRSKNSEYFTNKVLATKAVKAIHKEIVATQKTNVHKNKQEDVVKAQEAIQSFIKALFYLSIEINETIFAVNTIAITPGWLDFSNFKDTECWMRHSPASILKTSSTQKVLLLANLMPSILDIYVHLCSYVFLSKSQKAALTKNKVQLILTAMKELQTLIQYALSPEGAANHLSPVKCVNELYALLNKTSYLHHQLLRKHSLIPIIYTKSAGRLGYHLKACFELLSPFIEHPHPSEHHS